MINFVIDLVQVMGSKVHCVLQYTQYLNCKILHEETRRVARIWKRGGAILKEWEVCKQPWLEFSLFLNQLHTVCPKIETKFLGKLRNSKVFFAQNQVVSKKKKKRSSPILSETDFSAEMENFNVFSAQNQVVSKKKGLHRFWDWFFGRDRKFLMFFPLKIRWSPKKKKEKVFTKIETVFSAQIGNPDVWGGLFSNGGGYFQFFTKNRPQNYQNGAVLHTSQANGGGARAPPPPPGYATGGDALAALTNFTKSLVEMMYFHRQIE